MVIDNDILLATIKKSRAFLRRHKWGKGSYYKNEKYCAMGAVRAVLRNQDQEYSIHDAVQNYLTVNCVPNAGKAFNIIDYNDKPETTKKDIDNVFTCAIEKLEGARND